MHCLRSDDAEEQRIGGGRLEGGRRFDRFFGASRLEDEKKRSSCPGRGRVVPVEAPFPVDPAAVLFLLKIFWQSVCEDDDPFNN